MFRYGVFSGPYFPVFGLNTGKYRPEETPYRSSHRRCSVKKGVLRNFAKFTEKKPVPESRRKLLAQILEIKLFNIQKLDKHSKIISVD